MMNRYWDKTKHIEVIAGRHFAFDEEGNAPSNIVLLAADDPFLSALPKGKVLSIVDDMPVIVDRPAPTLDEVKAAKAAEVNSGYEAVTDIVIGGYPQREVDTFPEQSREAVAYEAATTPVVDDYPMLASIAAQAGRTLAEQVSRVTGKRTAFNAFCGALTGKRHALIAAIDAATTALEVDAVDPEELVTLANQLLGL